MAPYRQELEYIGLESLRVSPENVRSEISSEDQAGWEEFKTDIKEKGILQPLLVRKAEGGDGYEILAGRRRFLALQEIYSNREGKLIASAPAVPCEVVDVKEAVDREILSATENLHRSQMGPEEWKSVYDRLHKMGLKDQDIAKRLNRSKAWVSAIKSGKSWTDQKKTSTAKRKPTETKTEFDDTLCPSCAHLLGISLDSEGIHLEDKGKTRLAELVEEDDKEKEQGVRTKKSKKGGDAE